MIMSLLQPQIFLVTPWGSRAGDAMLLSLSQSVIIRIFITLNFCHLMKHFFLGGGYIYNCTISHFANERLWKMMKSSSWRCHLATAGLCHEAVTTWPWSLLASLWCLYSAASEQPLPVLCYPQVTISCCQMSRPGSHNHLCVSLLSRNYDQDLNDQ